MGEAKRRKQLDPLWSKPKSANDLLPGALRCLILSWNAKILV